MITVLTGENSFEVSREMRRLIDDFDGVPEIIDGAELELRQLPDLLMGGTLFATNRLVIIKRLSDNKALWEGLVEWLPRVSEDVHLVLIDEKPDKRTKTHKALQKLADMREYKPWGERDTLAAEKWTQDEAKRIGMALDAKNAKLLVTRVGNDQWQLFQALQKLRFVDTLTPEIIEEIIDPNPAENVFNLFDTALKGDGKKLAKILETLRISEDPYRLFGLISTQAFQLLALGQADKPHAEVAKDLGAHPFALSKLAPHAKRLGATGTKKVFTEFIEADTTMKTSAVDPWLAIERALAKAATVK